MKKCTKCGVEKPIEAFGRVSKARGGGPRPDCKQCAYAAAAAWQKANPERRKAISARYYRNNPERFAALVPKSRARWAALSDEKKAAAAERLAKWKAANRARCNASLAEYKFKKFQATPSWADADRIRDLYDLAAVRTKWTGHVWEVDHIVPLRSPIVQGLHTEHNLRVIPAVMNKQKSNRVWPDMPTA